jgi:hypothetical protein
MNRRISISQIIDRYQTSFGYVAANFAFVGFDRLYEQWGKSNIPLYTVQSAEFANMVFQNSVIDGKSYAFGVEGKFQGINYLAPPPMVSFSRDKHVVKTPIDKSDIEVIEYFGLKPFEIKIQGILIDTEEHHYPKQLVRMINEMFTSPGTFKVTSEIFQDMGITEVFFEGGFEVGFVEGYVDTVKFAVNAISTAPLLVKIAQQ